MKRFETRFGGGHLLRQKRNCTVVVFHRGAKRGDRTRPLVLVARCSLDVHP